MTEINNAKSLFQSHINKIQLFFDEIFSTFHVDRILIDAGVLEMYFEDDAAKNFRPSPNFSYLCPLRSAGHVIELQPGKSPVLHLLKPLDFWHEAVSIPNDFWTASFDIRPVATREDILKSLRAPLQRTVYCGPDLKVANDFGWIVNPLWLKSQLDWERSIKSDYEVACIEEANRLAANAHRVAENSFRQGKSEWAIHRDYLDCLQTNDEGLPYGAIVGLDEKGAVLHYEKKRLSGHRGQTLLIDSGFMVNGYASDITRTYYKEGAVPSTFVDLYRQLNTLQLMLCDACTAGKSYPDLHHLCNVEIHRILVELDILKNADFATALKEELIRCFYPHGLGHMLGIQVHDVGGQQIDRYGKMIPPPDLYPKLRSTRSLDPQTVTTIEPGIYFMPLLLDSFRHGEKTAHKDKINWALVDELIPLGGIRIEDNVLVTVSGPKNLTTIYLPH